MINHISRQSEAFGDFLQHGRASPSADLFITLDKVWPDGQPPDADVALIFLRKPDAPFSTVHDRRHRSGGARSGPRSGPLTGPSRSTSTSPPQATRALITRWLRQFADRGVRIVRLDAVGYVIKKPGTSCFMVEPEIYDFLAWVTEVADSFGLDDPARGPRWVCDP